ncbi:MAG: monovalent cation/H+ antiporter subunit D family protein [Agarilytica sp.]
MSAELLLQLSILLPLVAAPLIAFFGASPNIRESITMVSSVAVLVMVTMLYREFHKGGLIEVQWLEIMPGLTLKFKVEALGVLFSLVASLLWVVTSIYSIGYMRGNSEKHQTRFFMLFPIAISAALAIAFSGNLLTMFVFYEVMTLSTFPLVTHKGTEHAMKAGRIYLGVLISSSIGLFLPAIIWVWLVTGTTDFEVGGILAGHLDGVSVTILGFMFMLGIGKAAVMPMHRWLPAAMVAPTPVSALLHAVAVVKAGVFSLLKVIVYIFGIDHLAAAPWSEWLMYLACFTVVMSSIIAMQQDNLKRRLAYSTISQLSYVVLATMILAPLSVVGAAFHIAAHAVGKITLFFAAGSIYTASKKTEISQLHGIGKRMPWTMAAFAIGGFSMIGVPPLVGIISKWYLLQGAFQSEQHLAVIVILLSTLLNTAYFMPIVYRAYFLKEEPGGVAHGEAPLPIVIALSITSALTVGLFFFPAIPYELAEMIQVRP